MGKLIRVANQPVLSGQKSRVSEKGRVSGSGSRSWGPRRWCEISVHSSPECEQYDRDSENKENSTDSILVVQGTSGKYRQQQQDGKAVTEHHHRPPHRAV